MKLKLYHYWRSSSSWRVRWAMAIKGVTCEFVAVNLLNDETEQPEHLQRNPLGYVPVLEFQDGNPAHRYLAESIAMIEWLEETYPTPSLLPGTAFDRAKIRQLAEIINSGTQPIQNPNVAAFYSADPAEQKKWNQHWISRGLHAYETLVQSTAGKFSFGDEVTLADLFLIPQCYNALRFEVRLSDFPKIEKIYNEALKTKPCQDSAPDRFAPAG